MSHSMAPRLSLADVAAHFRCDEKTVKRIPRGNLPWARIGGSRLYATADVDAYLEATTSPHWYVRFLHPDGSGQRVSLSTEQEKRRAAEERGRAIYERYRNGWEREQIGGRVTALHVVEEYWNTEAKSLKAAKDHVLPHLERITAFLGDRAYCEVTIADVARFVDQLSEQVSPSTVNRALSIWRRMHNVATKKRLYPVKMIDWSSLRKIEPEPADRSIPAAYVKEILHELPERARDIVIFALMCGARKEQVLQLTWDRVDIENGTARIQRKHRKAYALHTIHLHPHAVRIIKSRPRGNDLGRVFDGRNFRKLWDAAVQQCGLKGTVRFHDLRHTFATELAKRAPLLVVKEQVGHSDLRVTQRYAHVARDDIQAAVRSLPGIDEHST